MPAAEIPALREGGGLGGNDPGRNPETGKVGLRVDVEGHRLT